MDASISFLSTQLQLSHKLLQAQSFGQIHLLKLNSYYISLESAAGGISLHFNADKTEYMCFNQRSDISTLIGSIYQPLRSGRIWHKVNF